jgi:glucose-1-phosphatase
MIKAVVLDIGGVLMRTEDDSGRRQLEKEYDIPTGQLEWFVFDSDEAAASTIGLVKANTVWNAIGKRLGLTPDELRRFIELFWQGDVFDKELFDFLSSLRPEYITGILSNAWEGARDSFIKRHGIIEGINVDHLLISAELGVAKPDAEVYRKLKQRLGVDYKEILFVDDYGRNIEGAQAMDIETIHYKAGMDIINQIKSRLG